MKTSDREKLTSAVGKLMEQLSMERLRLLYITALTWAGGEKQETGDYQ